MILICFFLLEIVMKENVWNYECINKYECIISWNIFVIIYILYIGMFL